MKYTTVMYENSKLKTVRRRMIMKEGRYGLAIIRRANHQHHGNPVATISTACFGGEKQDVRHRHGSMLVRNGRRQLKNEETEKLMQDQGQDAGRHAVISRLRL